MQCPSCGAGIPDDATRCEFCDRPVELSAEQRAAIRSAVSRPQRYHIEDDGVSLRIWWRWFSPAVFFLLPFAIAWNAFLVGWYSLASGGLGDAPWGMRMVFLVFPIGHVAVGLGLAYAVLTMLVNRSRVAIERGELSITHGPIPWPGVRLNADDIEQVYCVEAARNNKDGSQSFNVQARLKDGSTRTLLSYINVRQEAQYLEQAIEKSLRIRDVPVDGELPRH